MLEGGKDSDGGKWHSIGVWSGILLVRVGQS